MTLGHGARGMASKCDNAATHSHSSWMILCAQIQLIKPFIAVSFCRYKNIRFGYIHSASEMGLFLYHMNNEHLFRPMELSNEMG